MYTKDTQTYVLQRKSIATLGSTKRLKQNYIFNCRWLVKQMICIQAIYITMQLLAWEIYME